MRGATLGAIKLVHSTIFFTMLASLLVFVQRGLAGRSDRLALVSGLLVSGEALIFCGNGRRCPLRQLAEAVGEDRGSVTDLFLPRWIAEHIFEITAPIFALGIALQAWIWISSSRAGAGRSSPRRSAQVRPKPSHP